MSLFKTRKTSLVVLLFLLLFGIEHVYGISSNQLENYRIRIHKHSSSVTIKINNMYTINIDGVNNSYVPSSTGTDIVFTKSNGKISAKTSDGKTIGSGNEIKLLKKDNSVRYFEVKGIDNVAYAKYPDNAIIKLDSNKNEIIIINSTPLENYLKGVIPYEMGASAPLEAMKAQAITARTLAVKRVNKYNTDGFDITNTTSDQVYKGYNATYFASTHNVSKAVEQTKGIVLTYNGALVEGLYYSNNGGHTASDSFVWSSGSNTPYYVSKVDTFDTYLHKTSLNWGKIEYQESYSKKELKEKIIESSKEYPSYFKTPYCTPSFNGLSDNFNIDVIEEKNGYVTKLKLSDDQGREYILKNYANRWVFGLRSQQYKINQIGGLFVKGPSKINEMKSIYVMGKDGKKTEVDKSKVYIKNKSEIKTAPSIKYVFNGKGYGHGIGMSQNGAMNRAEKGHTYKQILEFYYTGTKTTSNYGK